MMNKEIIIYVVDDHPLYRAGFIRHLLDCYDFNIIEFGNIASALNALDEVQPKIVFLDLELPDGSGLTAIESFLAVMPSPKIVMLTTHRDANYIERAQQLGAHAYLLKDDHPDMVYRCLDCLDNSTDFFLSEKSIALLQDHSYKLRKENIDVSVLTMREKEVLYLLGKDLTSKEIAKHLGLSFRTVQNHRANIKSRLMLERNPQLLKVASASHHALKKLFASLE